MNTLSRSLVIATMIALGLAFSPEVSAKPGFVPFGLAGTTSEPAPGCKDSPVVTRAPKCPGIDPG